MHLVQVIKCILCLLAPCITRPQLRKVQALAVGSLEGFDDKLLHVVAMEGLGQYCVLTSSMTITNCPWVRQAYAPSGQRRCGEPPWMS